MQGSGKGVIYGSWVFTMLLKACTVRLHWPQVVNIEFSFFVLLTFFTNIFYLHSIYFFKYLATTTTPVWALAIQEPDVLDQDGVDETQRIGAQFFPLQR